MSLKQAVAFHQSGQFDEAENLYQSTLKERPDDPKVLNFLGTLKTQKKELSSAIEYLQKAIQIMPDYPQAHCNLGTAFEAADCLTEAQSCFEAAIAHKPDYPLAWFNLGNVHHKFKNYTTAIDCFEKAVHYKPDYAKAFMNCGLAQAELGLTSQADANYDTAINISPNYAEAFNNKGNLYIQQKRFPEALLCFDQALTHNPHYVKAFFNKGISLNALMLPEQAISSFDEAIQLKPDFIDAFLHRGFSYRELNQNDLALQSLHQALNLDDQNATIHLNLGNVYEDIRLFKEAKHHFQMVLALTPPDTAKVHVGTLMYIHMNMCDWNGYQQLIDQVMHRVQALKRSSELLPLLAISNSPRFLHQAGTAYCMEHYPSRKSKFKSQKLKRNSRIVIGYFSSDFNNHPLAHLISEVFELHDRSQFEIHAFSLRRKPQDIYTHRIIDNVDFFWDCGALSHSEILILTRECNLDIALDLNGFTGGCRMEIFAERVAPVQINYLGFPGTIGSTYHDYIIADTYLIPPLQQEHYSEKVIYLPCFQANDRKRRASNITPSRAQLNIPGDAFVFCCFNSSYKIQPIQFASWMRILSEVSGSVLWLVTDSGDVEKNLREQAQQQGVSQQRLIFSKKMLHPDYLASYVCADLFLDTYPFNAGTTASDALWMGLPLVTLSGNTFASRMAGSLLHAVGLPELITTNLEDYENLAIELANDPSRLGKLRQKLKANRSSCVLFDSPLFVSKLEEQYMNICKKY